MDRVFLIIRMSTVIIFILNSAALFHVGEKHNAFISLTFALANYLIFFNRV